MTVLNYKASPTAVLFHKSNAFVRGIVGPFGSGKSVICCWEVFMRASTQAPSKDGFRHSRWIVARNTQPQLETTTIKTWLDWFPEHQFGKMSRKPPFTHKLQINDIKLEVIFLALDKPEDVKKLLSFEVTGIWFNEAREIDYDIISAATGRVGRYPSQKDKPDNIPASKWLTWRGIIMDTNPPDDEHWYYKMAEEDRWAKDENGGLLPDFRKYGEVANIPQHLKWEFFKQPSGLSKEAENIENLPGGKDYYVQQIAGKTQEWINVYVHGLYGTIKYGMPVYGSAWNSDLHKAKAKLEPIPGSTVYIGVDSSGRHPAAVFFQKTKLGQILVLHELCVLADEGMGAVNFAKLLKSEINAKFKDFPTEIWGDPSGEYGQNTDERTYFDILHAEQIMIKSSPGLRFSERKEAVINVLSRFSEGKPSIVVSPTCKVLLRGFEGGYRFKKLKVSGDSRYDEKPEKNRYSDVHDALQYAICGVGELNRMYGRKSAFASLKTSFADTKFNVFGSRR